MAFSPDGNLIASGNLDRTARLWDAATGMMLHELKKHGSEVVQVAFSPRGGTLATASEDGTIRLWDTASGEERHAPLTGHKKGIECLAYAPDGSMLAHYAVPALCPTMCAFGGPDLRTVYVTSAREKRGADELQRMPQSGGIFAMRVDVPGLPEPKFAG